MNRRPNQSRNSYDSFSPRHAARFRAAAPDAGFFETRKKTPMYRRILLYTAAVILCILSLNFIVNHFVHVSRVSVPVRGLPESFEGYTLLHISDLKGKSFGSRQGLFSFALGKSKYDAVVLTGDMLSAHGNAQPLYALIETLQSRDPQTPIYYIAGDGDPTPLSMNYASGGSPFAPWVLGAQQRGAKMLRSPMAITRGEDTLYLATPALLSLDIDAMQKQFELQYIDALSSGDEIELELATYNLMWLEETRTARNAMDIGDPVIALSHARPDADSLILSPQSKHISLVLCGHALGGLIRLPGVGPLFVPSQNLPRYGLFPGAKAFSGLSRIGDTYVSCSTGLGSANDDYPPLFFRLFNPPSITLVTLETSSL